MKTFYEKIGPLITTKDVDKLCKIFFAGHKAAENLTPKQQDIVRIIAFAEHKRVAINCMTRYGKSQCVALGVALYIIFNKDKRVLLLAPQNEQTKILREYIASLIAVSPLLSDLVDMDRTNSADRLKKEASKQRITFKNGCEVRTLSAHGEADRLMGFGADLIIKDESCLIGDTANAKIMRMLGDDPDNAVLIEISNPWSRDNKYYEHYMNPDYYTIHVGWQDALGEGRVTEPFLEQMRAEYAQTPIFFTVLYESQFPDEAEDSLFKFSDIKAAVNRWEDMETDDIIIGADIADKGVDQTVITCGRHCRGYYFVDKIYAEAKSENVEVSRRILNMQKDTNAMIINVDCIGVGVGVLSYLKAHCEHPKVKIHGCHFGHGAFANGLYMNKKAEMYFKLKRLFEEGLICIPNNAELISDLLKMRWEKTVSGKIKIVDPEDKSPDYADSLVYFIWEQYSRGRFSMA